MTSLALGHKACLRRLQKKRETNWRSGGRAGGLCGAGP